jgi:ribosome-associated heat shock protein Hsp15
MEATRVDKWLWAVRLYPTRSAATEACRAGHVRVGGTVAKPATTVRVGDRVALRLDGRDRLLEVVQVIDTRVGASVAVRCLVDDSPPAPPHQAAGFARDPATGRPTKKDRRLLDRIRRR